jgi:hypothetical protein
MNQRGGRLLSLVDLIRANTVSLELAAHLVALLAKGASIASGAKAGGMGKTNLLAAILAFSPPGTRLLTVDGTSLHGIRPGRSGGVTDPPPRTGPGLAHPDRTDNIVYLCHEISPGGYYSYLWGSELTGYFGLADGRERHLAFTIHADSPEEIFPQIVNDSTGLSREDFMKLDVLVFINGFKSSEGFIRRVTGVFRKDAAAGRHVAGFEYSEEKAKNVHTLEESRKALLLEFGGV